MSISLLLIFTLSYAQEVPSIEGDSINYQEIGTPVKESESIYLQTSKDIYEVGEDLWFKAYVLNISDHTPSLKSKTLYVELVTEENNDVVWKEKYEIIDGFVDGHIFLSDSLIKGTYKLLAFSSRSFYNNQKNFYDFNTIEIVKDSNDLPIPTKQEKKKDSLDFQLLPEGGHLVVGLPCKVAFKATRSDGYPANVSGILLENGQNLLNFKCMHEGMGSFEFIPQQGREYYIKLTNDQDSGLVYKLPEIENHGITLHLLENNKNYMVFQILQTPGVDSRKVFLGTTINGIPYSIAEGPLEQSLVVKVPLAELPQGIAVVTLFDENYQPISERLVYVKPERKLYITTTLLGEGKFRVRDKVEIGIKVVDNKGKPVIANLGIGIHDWKYENKQNVTNIFTHYFLSTQLRGEIFDPEYYFSTENENRYKALDLLLLTQGWRSYVWEGTNIKKPAAPLVKDSIVGKVSAIGRTKNAPLEQIAVMAYVPGQNNNKDIFFLDSLGNFTVTPKHLRMGENGFVYVKLLVPSESRYDIHARDSTFKKIGRAIENVRYVENLAQINEVKPVEKEPLKNNRNIIQLEAVQVEGKKRRVGRNKYMASLDSVAKLELTNDYVCKHNYLNCPICIGDRENTKPKEGEIYGRLEVWDETRKMYVSGIAPREGQKFRNLSLPPYRYPKLTDTNLMNLFKMVRIEGYYGHQEFYQPRYDKDEYKDHPFPDFRNTLFWDSSVETNMNGEAKISFYCSDINTLFLGTVEGVGDGGLLGRETFQFLVKE